MRAFEELLNESSAVHGHRCAGQVLANPSPPSGWIENFHLQAAERAWQTKKSPVWQDPSRAKKRSVWLCWLVSLHIRLMIQDCGFSKRTIFDKSLFTSPRHQAGESDKPRLSKKNAT